MFCAFNLSPCPCQSEKDHNPERHAAASSKYHRHLGRASRVPHPFGAIGYVHSYYNQQYGAYANDHIRHEKTSVLEFYLLHVYSFNKSITYKAVKNTLTK